MALTFDAQVLEYQYLWDGTEPKWALLDVMPGNDPPRYLIVDTEGRAAKIIEDDVLAEAVIQRMTAAGIRVVSAGKGF